MSRVALVTGGTRGTVFFGIAVKSAGTAHRVIGVSLRSMLPVSSRRPRQIRKNYRATSSRAPDLVR
jgi:hypothetical protein